MPADSASGESGPRIVVITGPTAVGKTGAAIELALRFNGEIISADSMQIYRHMDIGTAKPDAVQRSRVVHHMIDLADPDEMFDARRFSSQARELIAAISERRKLPFVVGGTGLYIKALLRGLFESLPRDSNIRSRLKADAMQIGTSGLHERLKTVDAEAAEKIHPNDAFRIIRALEVFELTGKPISYHHQEHGFRNPFYPALKIGLLMDRDLLYRRIDERVDAMVAEGLLEEVQGLLEKGYSADLNSMQSIGYRHMADFIQGKMDWEQTLVLLKRDTRRYAKRQMTWFGADREIRWLEADQWPKAIEWIEAFLADDVCAES